MPASILRLASRSVIRRNAGSSPIMQRRSILTLKDTMYTGTATASGAGRNGNVVSNDGTAAVLDLKLALPKSLGGSADGANPEQLFATGYTACFLASLQLVAAEQGKTETIKDATVSASVRLGPVIERPGFGIAVDIEVSGVKDQELIQATHEFCPYSRALTHGAVVNVTSA